MCSGGLGIAGGAEAWLGGGWSLPGPSLGRPPDSASFQPPQRPLTHKKSKTPWRRKGPQEWECPAWFAQKFTSVLEKYPAGESTSWMAHETHDA